MALASDRPVGTAALDAPRGRLSDGMTHAVTALLLVVGVGTLIFMFVFVLHESFPVLTNRSGLPAFLFVDAWAPLSTPATYGIVHAWLSTLMMTAICLGLAVPAGFGIGLFISEVAPEAVRSVVQPCLDLLAGIPAVVYGFVGYVTILPLFEVSFDMATGESILAAAIILAIMVLPFVASLSAESFRTVPGEMREAVLANGVTRWYMIRRVIVPKAAPGMFAAATLAMARAVGETLAVLMLAGNSLAVPTSPLDRGQPLTALMATELGEAAVGSEKYHALFAAGAVLMAVVFAINAVTWILKRRLVKRHGA